MLHWFTLFMLALVAFVPGAFAGLAPLAQIAA